MALFSRRLHSDVHRKLLASTDTVRDLLDGGPRSRGLAEYTESHIDSSSRAVGDYHRHIFGLNGRRHWYIARVIYTETIVWRLATLQLYTAYLNAVIERVKERLCGRAVIPRDDIPRNSSSADAPTPVSPALPSDVHAELMYKTWCRPTGLTFDVCAELIYKTRYIRSFLGRNDNPSLEYVYTRTRSCSPVSGVAIWQITKHGDLKWRKRDDAEITKMQLNLVYLNSVLERLEERYYEPGGLFVTRDACWSGDK